MLQNTRVVHAIVLLRGTTEELLARAAECGTTLTAKASVQTLIKTFTIATSPGDVLFVATQTIAMSLLIYLE